MPPKKGAKPSLTLTGAQITFAGNTIPATLFPNQTLSDIKLAIADAGGQFVNKIEQVTHLVVTEAQYEKSLVKVTQAKQSPDIAIVKFEWLHDALSGKSVDDVSTYVFNEEDNSANLATQSADSAKNQKHNAEIDGEDNCDSKKHLPARASRTKKRSYSDDQNDFEEVLSEPETKKVKSDAPATNVTKNLKKAIPLDEGVSGSYKVYIHDDSTIYDATLNQSNAGANNNKFYRIQLLERAGSSFHVWTRWGRVGEYGQCAILDGSSLDDAIKQFNKKFKDKTGHSWDDRNNQPKNNKYVFIERNYDDSDDGDDHEPTKNGTSKIKKEDGDDEIEVVESKLDPSVQELVKLIFNKDYFNNTFADFDYDAQKMPLGKLSKNTLLRGYEILKQLAGLVGVPGSSHTQISNLSNQYLSIVPHVVPRGRRPPVISNMDLVKKEIELIEALTDMQLANEIMKDAKKAKPSAEEVNILDRQFQGLNLEEMEPLKSSSTEYKELQDYLAKTVGQTHGTRYKVQEIFRIERQGEKARFEQSKYATIPNRNRRLLWHGSRVTNFSGIISQGLRIAPPEAPVSGYMFGKGVYLADMSSKSANYCCAYTSGNTALLLLCEAELGEPPLKLNDSDYEAESRARQQGSISTWGLGQVAPRKWKDGENVHESLKGVSMPDVQTEPCGPTNEPNAWLQYNEYIVYDVAQIRLRYLFRVQM